MLKLAVLACLSLVLIEATSIESFTSFDQALEYEKSKYDFEANYRHDLNYFNDFMKEHSKVYANAEEKELRFNVFRLNLIKIKLLNAFDSGSAVYGLNHLADLTASEFEKQYTGFKFDREKLEETTNFSEPEIDLNAELPKEIDWREKGAVTEVKNQGSCGSCWAFSAIGAIEGQNRIVNNELVSLSEELIDCDGTSSGCNGGYMNWAYESLMKLGGVEPERDYPYKGKDGECAFKKEKSRVQLTGYTNITQDENVIAQYVAQNGPVSIAINANLMQFYLRGVAHPNKWLAKFMCNPKMLNHGVLIVGFGERKRRGNVEPYWIIKNSWSKSWGRDGYYYLYRGENMCGVSENVSAPKVMKK